MSLAQTCAEVVATIERARSLFSAAPVPAAAADDAAAQLSDAAASTAATGQSLSGWSGAMMNAHRDFVDTAAPAVSRAGATDTKLSARARVAAEVTRSGAARLDALASESRATVQAAGAVTTRAGQRAILAALKSQVDRTNEIVSDTRRRSGELAGKITVLDYPLQPPPTPTEPDPNHLPESAVDGIHGTASEAMPIITRPGELGPPNSGMNAGGTDWVEAIPGSGVWIPSDQISGKLWMPSYPGELAPANYEEIAPGIWWPQPPSVDPGVDHPSYRGDG